MEQLGAWPVGTAVDGPRMCVWYLSTRSEAWLDLDTSQLWCFSWAFANFSAAAIGHPERLQ